MKLQIKKLLVLLCVFQMTFMAFGFSAFASESELTASQIEAFETAVEGNLDNLLSLDDETIEYYAEAGDETIIAWDAVRSDLGAAQYSGAEHSITYDADTYRIESKFNFSGQSLTVVSQYDTSGTFLSMTFELSSNSTLADKMVEAGLNTVIGLVSVFAILLFLSFLISLFKYIPGIVEKFAHDRDEENPDEAPAFMSIAEKYVQIQKEELTDDLELAAVIAAAIAAAENTSTDSFTVRSIKRAGGRRRI